MLIIVFIKKTCYNVYIKIFLRKVVFKMNYIKNTFKLINKIKAFLNINEVSYTETVRVFRGYEEATLTNSLRNEIIEFLESLNIQYLQSNIAHILMPEVSRLELDDDYVFACVLNDLNDTQIVNYFGMVIWSISINEMDKLILLKYNKCIYNTGWHNLAKLCRGKIIEDGTYDIVSYPFDKFFNLGEVEESNELTVAELIKNTSNLYVTDKKDGSTIIVSKYKGKAIVTTNGSFDNIQISLAKELFKKKYNEFYDNIPEGFTFVFELIHPENKIILDYGNDEKLYLLAIRNLKTLKLLPFENVSELAKQYKLDLVDSESFTSLDNMMKLACDMQDANKEGWVVRLVGKDFDFMFKLKLQEYFLLHRSMSSVSLKKVYTLIQTDEIDTFLNLIDDEVKEDVLGMIEEINIARNNIKDEVLRLSNELLKNNNVTREEFLENREVLIKVINDAFKLPLGGLIVKNLKCPEKLDLSIFKISTKKFMENFKQQ